MRTVAKAGKIKTPRDLERLRARLQRARSDEKTCIVIPSSTCCQARGSSDIVAAFKKAIAHYSLDGKV
ncbi:MAG: (2Fe-2S) ferredoxin domain-containing protein, partial [Dehalococcoidales bacterium]|nr:(2Fe-2S) ferredoxin domain-containing protein [Dehalococcoidales bacterium]